MQFHFQFLLSLLCLLCLAAETIAKDVNGRKVHRISSAKEFDSMVRENDMVLAAFVSPLSEPSKSLQSELELAAVAGLTKTPIVTIDCTQQQDGDDDLCKRYYINAYPTIRLFRGEDLEEENYDGHTRNNSTRTRSIGSRYRDARTASAINSYLLKQHLPAVTILSSKDALDHFKAIDNHVFVAYLGATSSSPSSSASPKKKDKKRDSTDDRLKEIFTSVAHDYHHKFVFGIVLGNNNGELVPEMTGATPPYFVSYKLAEGDNEVLPTAVDGSEYTKEMLEAFVETTAKSVIGEITRRNMDGYFASGKTILAYIFYTSPAERTLLRKELIPVAKRYRGYVQFVTIDALEYGHMARVLNLEGNNFPAFVVHSMFNDQVFVYDEEKKITGKEVDEFVLGILQGRISASSEKGTKNDHRDEL